MMRRLGFVKHAKMLYVLREHGPLLSRSELKNRPILDSVATLIGADFPHRYYVISQAAKAVDDLNWKLLVCEKASGDFTRSRFRQSAVQPLLCGLPRTPLPLECPRTKEPDTSL